MSVTATSHAEPVPAQPDTTPLLWGKAEACRKLGISPRSFDRLRAAKEFPPPDVTLGRLVKWRPETVKAWVDRQAKRKGGK